MSMQQQFVRERGAVLVISIVLLVVLTLLGLYLSQSGLLEFRMAENAASRSIALQAAETTRSLAETQAGVIAKQVNANGDQYDCTTLGNGYYAASSAGTAAGSLKVAAVVSGCNALDPNALKWDDSDSLSTQNGTRYVIEYLGIQDIKDPKDVELGQPPPTYHVFRILARGQDAGGGNVTLQSIYVALNT